MQFKRFERFVRKQVKRQRRQAEQLASTADAGIERNLFRRFRRLKAVRRFVLGWALLMGLLVAVSVAQFQHLSGYYQKVAPVPGGIYSEGMVGSISNVNPIYATSDVDRSLSRLLFSGLLTHDTNGKLVNDLASNMVIGENGRTYTLTLKPGLTWQDGQPVTSADVVFTFATIKDPDARSPLLSSWQNVTVTASSKNTVVFTLPGPLASFPNSLTTGIIPQHILGKISAINMRSSDFNTVSPVGTGPFMWHGLQANGNDPSSSEEQVALVPFNNYALGKPKLNEFIVRSFAAEDSLKKAFASGQLTAAADLDTVPADASKSTLTHDLLLNAGTYVFYKTTTGVLQDAKVRQALNAASNPSTIIKNLNFATRPVIEPLLIGQIAYNKDYAQKTNNADGAKVMLQQDGWQYDSNGRAMKDGKQLQFSLVATDTSEYRQVTKQLRAQWQAIGVRVDVQLLAGADYSTALAGHEYDATLYGISIGQDPDVYAYWDGSQADIRSSNRLNLSEWNNATANSALEAGRSRLDPALRTIKYAPFLQAWQQDAPALGLYQPRFLYLTRGQLFNLTQHTINNNIDRYNGVQNWEVRSARVTQ